MVYRICILGFGGVSQAAIKILHSKPALAEKFSLVAVSDQWKGSVFNADGLDWQALADLPSEQSVLASLPNGSAKADNQRLIASPDVDVLIETTFTNPVDGEPALSHCRQALQLGKHVITTNKGPVAFAGRELEALAAIQQRRFLYEGSVMSGTPTLNLIDSCLQGARITAFSGIMNGTCNYILSEMAKGLAFNQALSQAQALSFAENDPSADIEGFDVALKVMILANQVMQANINFDAISRCGISDITAADVAAANEQDSCWKLLGSYSPAEGASVKPVKLSQSHPLAGINGATNALLISTDHLGDICISGPGAGLKETGYSIITDLLSLPDSLPSKQSHAEL